MMNAYMQAGYHTNKKDLYNNYSISHVSLPFQMPKRRRGCGYSRTKFRRQEETSTKEQIAGQFANTCSSIHDKPSIYEIKVIMLLSHCFNIILISICLYQYMI